MGAVWLVVAGARAEKVVLMVLEKAVASMEMVAVGMVLASEEREGKAAAVRGWAAVVWETAVAKKERVAAEEGGAAAAEVLPASMATAMVKDNLH